jgi:hypothetical protein
MAKTTFSGPVRSLAGFITAGDAVSVNLTADTTLTVDAHAGKMIRVNDADCKITLPTIVATAPTDPTDPNSTNNIGAQFWFFIETLATDLDIRTDGTDKFVGSVQMVDTDTLGSMFGYVPSANNDVMTLNGTTTGGIVGSWIRVTALASLQYLVEGVLLGSGAVVTPFADA